MRDDPSRVAQKIDEQVELLRREVQFAPAQTDAVREEVCAEVAGFEQAASALSRGSGARRRAARMRASSSSIPNGFVT